MRCWTRIESPIGDLVLVAESGTLCEIRFTTGSRPAGPPADCDEGAKPLEHAVRQLGEYFAGTRRTFDLPLAPRGTAFQRKVWDALLRVEYGRTASYGEIARGVGNPKPCGRWGSRTAATRFRS
jgi:methylated-DNA-[protein]-cysteine S-methyltransferase